METIKLNIGGAINPIDGYINLDRKTGDEAFPLSRSGIEFDDASVDEIRASHVLEHFPHRQVLEVMRHWVAKLKPGGRLKIAVPDFHWIAEQYLAGAEIPVEGYVMGGQTDADDYHRSTFNAPTLVDHFRACGLSDIAPWHGDTGDCSGLPVSLNVQGVKPVAVPQGFRVTAVMSLPRTHWTANFRCAECLAPMGIPLRSFEGVYWGQCLERGMDTLIGEGVDAILTIDYDTVYTAEHVKTLIRLLILHPEADAICAMQSARGWDSVLATVDLPDGMDPGKVPKALFDADLLKLKTGHFGLTLIRASTLRDVPRPWFLATPAPDGSWGEGHQDEDIHFWRNWAKAGRTLYAANRVAVGHIEPMIKWPNKTLTACYQRSPDYFNLGPPKEVWR